jgi:hypothetical protein
LSRLTIVDQRDGSLVSSSSTSTTSQSPAQESQHPLTRLGDLFAMFKRNNNYRPPPRWASPATSVAPSTSSVPIPVPAFGEPGGLPASSVSSARWSFAYWFTSSSAGSARASLSQHSSSWLPDPGPQHYSPGFSDPTFAPTQFGASAVPSGPLLPAPLENSRHAPTLPTEQQQEAHRYGNVQMGDVASVEPSGPTAQHLAQFSQQSQPARQYGDMKMGDDATLGSSSTHAVPSINRNSTGRTAPSYLRGAASTMNLDDIASNRPTDNTKLLKYDSTVLAEYYTQGSRRTPVRPPPGANRGSPFVMGC